MSRFKRNQQKYVKKVYRVRNWHEYEAGLRSRGSLTVWILLTDDKLANWDAPRPTRRRPGRQRKYSNHAIETAVTLGMVLRLASRQAEGFLRSLFVLLKFENDRFNKNGTRRFPSEAAEVVGVSATPVARRSATSRDPVAHGGLLKVCGASCGSRT